MSLALIASPIKTVKNILSNVNAAITQLPFTFKREDYPSDKILESAGNIRSILNSSVGDVQADFPAGTIVYVSQTDYQGLHTVLSTTFNVNTSLILDTNYTGDNDFIGYVNNLSERSDYVVEIQILNQNDVLLFDEIFVYKPSQAGNLFIDLGAVIVTYMEENKLSFVRHKIRYRETWTGNEPAFTSTDEMLSTLGEKSTGEAGGSNLWEYLLKLGSSIFDYKITDFENLGSVTNNWAFTQNRWLLEDTAGAFSTSLGIVSNTTLQSGIYKFIMNYRAVSDSGSLTISKVVDNAGIGNEILTADGLINTITLPFDVLTTGVDFFGIRAAPIAGQENNTIEVFSINVQTFERGDWLTKFKGTFTNPKKMWRGFTGETFSFIVDNDLSNRIGTSSPSISKQPIDINLGGVGAGINTTFTSPPPAIREYTLEKEYRANQWGTRLRLFAQVSPFNPISRDLILQYLDPCKNAVMLEWVNSLGAREYHLFEINQQLRLSSSDGLVFDEPVTQDVENINRQTTRLSSDEVLQLTLTAEEVTKDDLRALHELKTSEAVNVWLTNDGLEKIGVTVSNIFETVFATEDATNTFNVEIAFPSDYDFFNLKKY